MTGEITLRGKVLLVGGIRDKTLAAHRAGLKQVVLPRRNEGDLEDVPPEVREALRFVLVDSADEVLRATLELDAPGRAAPAEPPAPRALTNALTRRRQRCVDRCRVPSRCGGERRRALDGPSRGRARRRAVSARMVASGGEPMSSKLLRLSLAAATVILGLRARAADAPRKSDELVEKGRAAFADYCASCHGLKGEGDGPAARALIPPPRNLVANPTPGGARAVFRVLNTGVQGTGMGAFNYLPEEERWGIAYYVESLAGRKK